MFNDVSILNRPWCEKNLKLLHVNNEDQDQPAHPLLIHSFPDIRDPKYDFLSHCTIKR